MEQTLQVLTDQWLELETLLNAADGELDETTEKRLDELCTALAEKRSSYVFVREQLDTQIDQDKKWIQIFKARVDQLEKRKKYLDEKLKTSMDIQGINEQQTELGKIKIWETEIVEIVDEKNLPSKYFKVVQEFKVLNNEIKAALKSGEDVPGAILMKNKHVRIS